MSGPSAARPRLLLVGGGGGFVGRAVVAEMGTDWRIRSVHRRPSPDEAGRPIEWVAADAATVRDWEPLLAGVDLVVNLAWYRAGADRRFRPLAEGLVRLIDTAARRGGPRFVQVSVPDAPEAMERTLPYLARKREVDRHLASSPLDYVILRPTMLFGPRDKLLTVMLATMRRYRRFPMFGDGSYHVSPLAVRDFARVLRREAAVGGRRTVDVGGPRRWVYAELTDRMFRALGATPRYVRFSPRGAVRLARLLEAVGSARLYAYEVEWLLSDRLGLPAYAGLDPPLADVAPFLDEVAGRLRSR